MLTLSEQWETGNSNSRIQLLFPDFGGRETSNYKPKFQAEVQTMPRPPRIQFAGAYYHITTRGDGRRKLFHDTEHYQRFTKGLEDEVQRGGWIVLAYCWMPNHIHALIQTLEPNLAKKPQPQSKPHYT